MSQELLEQIRGLESIRRPLSGGGVLNLDRGLPFLLVYREPDGKDRGTKRLIAGESSYLIARKGDRAEVPEIVRGLAENGSSTFGAFLVLELWSGDPESHQFVIHAPRKGLARETIDKLADALDDLRELRPGLEVEIRHTDDRHPPGLPPLLTIEESWQKEVLVVGVEVPPIYRDPSTHRPYPRFVRDVQQHFSRALRQSIYEFVRVQTSADVKNHLALGTRSLPDAVWEIDRELIAIERAFDILLLTSPINFDQAWERFQNDGYDRNPEFRYRLLPLDPDVLKRKLYAIEMEEVDDPAIADLFRDKRYELDTLLTMIGERGTSAFRHNSHRLYGSADPLLLELSRTLLEEVESLPPHRGEWVDAHAFRAKAEEEMRYYAGVYPALANTVQLRRDVNGLMVSEGNLLIGENLRIRPERLLPLLHHEVGTHVLTYVNGSAQPLEQLSLGLADYDELQEGLAVLSEYLVGGLDALRMRLLAARVLAAHSVEQGADFVDTFRMLTDEYGYTPSGAWHITTRVHASGGFTRDMIYLRGLVRLIAWIEAGGDLERLYIGKIAEKHIPVIEELRHREVLRDPPLTPRFFEDAEARQRLERVRTGITLTEMICRPNA